MRTNIVSVLVITSLGDDIKLLALSPTFLYTKLAGDVKDPTSLFENCRGYRPRCCGLTCLTCIYGLGGKEISYMDRWRE